MQTVEAFLVDILLLPAEDIVLFKLTVDAIILDPSTALLDLSIASCCRPQEDFSLALENSRCNHP